MLTRDEVIWAYRYLLGREPESEQVLLDCSTLENTGVLRERILRSEEFQAKYRRLWPEPPPGLRPLARRLVFLHVPKTGGTSLHATLSSHFAPERFCPERFNGLRDWRLGALAAFDYYSGHFDYESCLGIPGASVQMVTLLRDPVRRLLSLYYFLRAHRQDYAEAHGLGLALLARALPPDQFFAHPQVVLHPSVRDSQTRSLTLTLPAGRWEALAAPIDAADPLLTDPAPLLELAWSRLCGMTSFGLMEDLDASLQLFSQALGLDLQPVAPQQVLEDIMVSNGGLEPVQRPTAHPPELISQLEALTVQDRALYARAQALFHSRLARRPPVAPAAPPAGAGPVAAEDPITIAPEPERDPIGTGQSA